MRACGACCTVPARQQRGRIVSRQTKRCAVHITWLRPCDLSLADCWLPADPDRCSSCGLWHCSHQWRAGGQVTLTAGVLDIQTSNQGCTTLPVLQFDPRLASLHAACSAAITWSTIEQSAAWVQPALLWNPAAHRVWHTCCQGDAFKALGHLTSAVAVLQRLCGARGHRSYPGGQW